MLRSSAIMLLRHQIVNTLLTLGFEHNPSDGSYYLPPVRIDLLDGPRLRATSPSGLSFLAALSTFYLEQQLADLLHSRFPNTPPQVPRSSRATLLSQPESSLLV